MVLVLEKRRIGRNGSVLPFPCLVCLITPSERVISTHEQAVMKKISEVSREHEFSCSDKSVEGEEDSTEVSMSSSRDKLVSSTLRQFVRYAWEEIAPAELSRKLRETEDGVVGRREWFKFVDILHA